MGNIEDNNLLFLGKNEIIKQFETGANTLCFEKILTAL